MTDPQTLRDSTQILLPESLYEGVNDDITAQFTVTVVDDEEGVRIIGSPVEIKAVNEFLTRQGITLA